jgi:hypothetical protein
MSIAGQRFTRREFLGSTVLIAGAAGADALGLFGGGADDGVIRVALRRPADMLVLRFAFTNAVLNRRKRRLYRAHLATPITAIVTFPAQHVDEEAFYESAAHEPPGAVPVWSQASCETRLCFDLASSELTLSPASLLDWTDWAPRLVDELRLPADVAAPAADRTAIELPTRLILSPAAAARWRHAANPVTHDGRTELWHTRLSGTSSPTTDVRAVWTPDYVADPTANPPPWEPKITPLDARDRNGFVHDTHVKGFDPEPIGVDVLALSAAGGWLSFEHRWSESVRRQGYPISWKQRTSGGRDDFTEVEQLAFLYPFGFKVSVVKTSERKAQDVPGAGQDGFLRQHFTIKFEERFRDYDDWRFPFSRLVPTSLDTPYLDVPTSIPFPGHALPDWRDGAFWPMVLEHAYEFGFTATDRAGRESHFTAPLICVPLKNLAAGTADARLPVVQAAYVGEPARATRPWFGQSVGFAPEHVPMATSHPVSRIAFDGVLKASLPADRIVAPFAPLCASAELGSSTGVALGGSQPEQLGWFRPADPAATKPEIYLMADAQRGGGMTLGFVGQSDKAGGVAAPQLRVGGFARGTGPFGQAAGAALVGAAPAFANDSFDPLQFFDADATILGVRLSSVLRAVSSAASAAAPQILSVLNRNIDDVPMLDQRFDWVTEHLQDAPRLGPVAPLFLTQQDSPDRVPDPSTPTRFAMSASASIDLLGAGTPDFTAYGRLSNFTIQLAVDIGSEPNGVLLKIGEAWFRAHAGEKTQFGIDLKAAEMIGTILRFIQQLQEALSPSLSHVAQLVDVSPDGVRISLPPLVLPPLTLGALDITDIRIISSATLPFGKKPPQFSFAFSSPDQPFIVAVGIFGGGGYVSITLDTMGIQAFSAMFQFGGYRALELGVVRGRLFLFGGIIFSSERLTDGNPGSRLTIVAFIHAGGEASVFGIVTVGVDFYMSLTYQTGSGSSDLYGDVRLTYSVRIGFFSRSASVHYTHVLKGSHASQRVSLMGGRNVVGLTGPRDSNRPADFMKRDEWLEFSRAFAA